VAYRAAQAALVTYLRWHANASLTEITAGGVTFWTDDQLSAVLDENGVRAAIAVTEPITGTFVLDIPRHYWLDSDTIALYDSNDVELTDTVTYNPLLGEITTLTTTPHHIKAVAINMFECLAHVWEMKAAHRFDYINIKGGSNAMAVEQEYNHCIHMRDHYRNRIIRRHDRKRLGRWTPASTQSVNERD